MIKNPMGSDSERGNPLPPPGLFLISSKGSFICTIPDTIAHTTAFVTPVVEHWLEQDIAQWGIFNNAVNIILINGYNSYKYFLYMKRPTWFD